MNSCRQPVSRMCDVDFYKRDTATSNTPVVSMKNQTCSRALQTVQPNEVIVVLNLGTSCQVDRYRAINGNGPFDVQFTACPVEFPQNTDAAVIYRSS